MTPPTPHYQLQQSTFFDVTSFLPAAENAPPTPTTKLTCLQPTNPNPLPTPQARVLIIFFPTSSPCYTVELSLLVPSPGSQWSEQDQQGRHRCCCCLLVFA